MYYLNPQQKKQDNKPEKFKEVNWEFWSEDLPCTSHICVAVNKCHWTMWYDPKWNLDIFIRLNVKQKLNRYPLTHPCFKENNKVVKEQPATEIQPFQKSQNGQETLYDGSSQKEKGHVLHTIFYNNERVFSCNNMLLYSCKPFGPWRTCLSSRHNQLR